MDPSHFDDGTGILPLCLVVVFSCLALWLVVSFLISWMSRRGEERIRRMEKLEHKLSARIR